MPTDAMPEHNPYELVAALLQLAAAGDDAAADALVPAGGDATKGVRDAAGYEHDASNGRFTSGGGGAARGDKPAAGGDAAKPESGGDSLSPADRLRVEAARLGHESVWHIDLDQQRELAERLGWSRNEFTDARDAAADKEDAGDPIPEREGGDEKPGRDPAKANGSLPDEARPDLSAEEEQAVREYVAEDSGYDEINTALRAGADPDRFPLQAAVERAGDFPEPVKCHRGLEFEDDADFAKFAAGLKEAYEAGEPWTERGFTSASTGGAFPGNVQLTVIAHRGLDASYYADNRGEILLPAGSDFRVRSLKIEGTRLRAEIEQVV